MTESIPVTTQRRTNLLICAAIAVVTLVLYWPVHSHEFVNYDDDDYVAQNMHVVSGLNWTNLKWAFSTGQGGCPNPLTWLTHQADAEVFGSWAGGHHLTSLFIHVLNSILL